MAIELELFGNGFVFQQTVGPYKILRHEIQEENTSEDMRYRKLRLWYEGFGRCESVCDVEITEEVKEVQVKFSQIPENHGTSITNMIEWLATMVYHHFLKDTEILPENIIWTEFYDREKVYRKLLSGEAKQTFDRVIMQWNGSCFHHPQWKRIKNK